MWWKRKQDCAKGTFSSLFSKNIWVHITWLKCGFWWCLGLLTVPCWVCFQWDQDREDTAFTKKTKSISCSIVVCYTALLVLIVILSHCHIPPELLSTFISYRSYARRSSSLSCVTKKRMRSSGRKTPMSTYAWSSVSTQTLAEVAQSLEKRACDRDAAGSIPGPAG